MAISRNDDGPGAVLGQVQAISARREANPERLRPNLAGEVNGLGALGEQLGDQLFVAHAVAGSAAGDGESHGHAALSEDSRAIASRNRRATPGLTRT